MTDALVVLRLEEDLLMFKLGVDCLSPRYELATDGDLERGRGETEDEMESCLGVAGLLYAGLMSTERPKAMELWL